MGQRIRRNQTHEANGTRLAPIIDGTSKKGNPMTIAQEKTGSAAFPVIAPDMYQLHGDQLHITYSTTGFDGKPRFDYQDATQIKAFTGDEIRTVTTEIAR
jgi:hypothetical protein